jgi:peptidoglycan/xylan/chitin deacetylase (PgdA/CDA1 family)
MAGENAGVFKQLVVGILGTRLVSGATRRVLRNRLRVLAYHGVADPAAFERQLRVLTSEYTPVNGATVVGHLNGELELPSDAIWVTFDDGWSDVVEFGLPLLLEYGVPASMFVCPSLVESGRPHWWETVSRARDLGWALAGASGRDVVTYLKCLPDSDRRTAVLLAETFVGEQTEPSARRPADVALLRRWQQSGMELGNHSWDHPCLNCCSPPEQRRQLQQADTWLQGFGAFDAVRLFAYPNGDWTRDADAELVDMGYDVCLLFDHRIGRTTDLNPRRLSRLRIDSSDSVRRWRAIASGGHSLLYRPRVEWPIGRE